MHPEERPCLQVHGFALNKEEAYKRDKIMEQFKNMML